MAIYNNCKMTTLTPVGRDWEKADHCTVRIGEDDIRVEIRYKPGDESQVWQGKKDPQGIFRLKPEQGGDDDKATLCQIDNRLIGDWEEGGASGLWKLDLGE